MRAEHKKRDLERGQVLVLFTLMFTALILCIMVVVDVGFFLHKRQQVQATADAAALAGAQELPEDPDLAQEIALDYVELNGLDPNDVTISFRCTSDTQLICLDGDGRYDTIVVTPEGDAPNFFGGVLAVVGVDNCWVDGCNVTATAAGCRGACGPVGNAPVDAIEIIDRTGSMSASDLTNAKNAAKSILEYFNPSLQNVGLGTLGPSSTSSTCSGSNSPGKGIATSGTGTWLPIGLVNDYQLSNGTLNTNSLIVKTINCFNTSSVGTNLGDPVKAAYEELQANGRPDVTWGIILFTDGAANNAPETDVTTTLPGDTGWNDCDSEAANTSSAGDNNGYQTNPSRACANSGSYATDANSGTTSTTNCPDTTSSGGSGASGKDKHRFYDFDLSGDIPGGATLTGIEVKLDGMVSQTTGTNRFCVQLSWNGGTNWTTAKQTNITSTSEQAYLFGGSTDFWGRSWTSGEFSNSNFRVRVTNIANVTTRTFSLDDVWAKVHYTTTSTTTVWDGHLGPCDYAMTQATAAKALGIEVYTIGYNVEAADCVDEYSSSAWDGEPVLDLLLAMATDEDHFFESPQGTDLEPIFTAIGGDLTASGSRLVE